MLNITPFLTMHTMFKFDSGEHFGNMVARPTMALFRVRGVRMLSGPRSKRGRKQHSTMHTLEEWVACEDVKLRKEFMYRPTIATWTRILDCDDDDADDW